MDYNGAKAFILGKLKHELNPGLYYHNYEHTLDVYEAAGRLAEREKISTHEKILLRTAALFHDAGFLKTYQGHENYSIDMAREFLPQFGYSDNDIQQINGLIRATELPQHPLTNLEMILADADLDYLGRDDFFMISHQLRYEWFCIGIKNTLKEWYMSQFEFLSAHRYFTKSATAMRERGKQNHIQQIKELLSIPD